MRWSDAGKRVMKDVKDCWKGVLAAVVYLVALTLLTHEACPMRLVFGIPCPACGMTRAFWYLATLRPVEAWQMNPFAFPFLAFAVWFGIRRYLLGRKVLFTKIAIALLFIGMIVFYIYRMIYFFPGEEPMTFYRHSVLQTIMENVSAE